MKIFLLRGMLSSCDYIFSGHNFTSGLSHPRTRAQVLSRFHKAGVPDILQPELDILARAGNI